MRCASSDASREGHRVFFVPPPWPDAGATLALPESESHHAGRVFRLRAGDEVRLIDGAGRLGRARITLARGRRVEVQIEDARRVEPPPGPELQLALPALRSGARLDWAIEKATELGVGGLHIYAAVRGLKKDAARPEVRERRWRELVRSACKQSGRLYCPRLATHTSLRSLLGATAAGTAILVADAAGDAAARDAGAWGDASSLLLVVGPEGGLTDDEDAALRERAAHRVSLGPHRLRTETAAIALCAVTGGWVM
jgi:16S rRNA (uracil1498-N3)-methyltransferase